MNASPAPATRLLIAEDEPLIRKAIISAARDGGFCVAGEAGTGHEAVAQALQLKPDAILMDIMMPGIDGLEATRRIQARHPTPTVIVTAHQTPELIQDVAECGAGAYLLKPPNPSDLARGITVAMARHSEVMTLKDRVRHKDLLVREVYHRMANHLSTTSALLNLQALRIRHTAARSALQEAEHRLLAMARIHTTLQQTGGKAPIPLGPHLSSLARDLITALRPDLTFMETITGPSISTSDTTAMNCGLIVHELVMNCIRHAFSRRTSGRIELSLQTGVNGLARLSIRDNGSGLPKGFSIGRSDSLGLMIVSSLTDDLGGQLSLAPLSPGTECVVLFKPPPQEPL